MHYVNPGRQTNPVLATGTKTATAPMRLKYNVNMVAIDVENTACHRHTARRPRISPRIYPYTAFTIKDRRITGP